jgi:H+-translocating NAD(P) transhydrogenase subunit alpha
MILGILKEHGDETRVALLPDNVQILVRQNVEVLVEKGAGDLAFVSDADY